MCTAILTLRNIVPHVTLHSELELPVVLSASSVIDESNYFGFSFRTLE